MSNSFYKSAYNDVLGKGWDSAAQFSFCIQESLKGNPQFWWVPQALRKFPHPPDWSHVSRDSDGKYKNFPSAKGALVQRLEKFANNLMEKGYKEEAEQVIKVVDRFVFAGYEDLLRDIERIEDLLRKGTLNKLTLVLIGKENLADRFDKELGKAVVAYIPVIKDRLLEIIDLLQMVKQDKDANFIEAADEILDSLQKIRDKHGI